MFSKVQILLLRGYYEEVLRAMIGDPGAAHDARSWLSPGERHQILLEYNDTAFDFSQELCLHRLFEKQAALTPGAVAVSYEDSSLSYGELDARAEHLARRLRRLGVGPDVVVGICAERSLKLMVGLLGILKAGGAYLPLDPSYPQERLTFMVEEGLTGGDRPVLLAQKQWSPLFADWSAPARARMIDPRGALGADRRRAWRRRREEGGRSVEPGLCHLHLRLDRPAQGGDEHPRGDRQPAAVDAGALGLDADDRVLQKTPSQLRRVGLGALLALLTGARLVVARPRRAPGSAVAGRLIDEQGITTLHFVPSMLHAFLEEPDLHRCARCGG